MKSKSLQVNAFLSALKSFMSMAFPLITFPYVSRVLQVENIGKINFSNSIIGYISLIAGLGIGTYAIREGARKRDSQEDINRFASQVFSINLMSSLIAYAILFTAILISPKLQNYTTLLVIQSITIIGSTLGIDWVYSIYEDFLYITIRSLLFQIISLILLFLLIHDQNDYILYTAISVFSNVGSNICNLWHSKKYIKFSITFKNLKQHMRSILIIFTTTIATVIYVNSDTTMLGFFIGNYSVGIYSTAGKIYMILKSLLSATILVALPRLSNCISKKMKEDYQNLVSDIFKIVIMIMPPVVVGLYMVAPSIIRFIAGKNYIDSQYPLKILSISLFFSIFGIFFTNAVLLPLKKEKFLMIITIISASINIILNLVMIPIFKENGAAFTTVIAEGMVAISGCIYTLKLIKLQIDKKYIFSILIGCFSVVGICLVVDKLMMYYLVDLITKVLLASISYFVILFIMRNKIVCNTVTTLQNKLHRK